MSNWNEVKKELADDIMKTIDPLLEQIYHRGYDDGRDDAEKKSVPELGSFTGWELARLINNMNTRERLMAFGITRTDEIFNSPIESIFSAYQKFMTCSHKLAIGDEIKIEDRLFYVVSDLNVISHSKTDWIIIDASTQVHTMRHDDDKWNWTGNHFDSFDLWLDSLKDRALADDDIENS